MKKFAAAFYFSFLLLANVLVQPQTRAQNQDKDFIERLMQSRPEWFAPILDSPGAYEVQIIYTRIDRDRKNHPYFRTFSYRLDNDRYFYPASTVKLPLAVLALEKLNERQVDGLNRDTPLRIDSGYLKQIPLTRDSTAPGGFPSIAHFIKKVFLVSDNWAYNRLYEFVGQREIRERLSRRGLNNIRILHRFIVGDTRETSRHTNPFTFYRGEKIIYRQPSAYNELNFFKDLQPIFYGNGYIDGEGRLIQEPFSFTAKNFFPLGMQHELLKRILFPESYNPSLRFDLRPDDYRFLYTYLSMLPRESTAFPDYSDTAEYWDSYAKFLMYGSEKGTRIPPHIRIFNKIGVAYGYVTDNAYIVDFHNKVEFLLTATIATNSDGVFNDDTYDYEKTGYPFMEHLGRLFYEYELARPRKHQPDLEKFRLSYKP